jgi:hypothetical protein
VEESLVDFLPFYLYLLNVPVINDVTVTSPWRAHINSLSQSNNCTLAMRLDLQG